MNEYTKSIILGYISSTEEMIAQHEEMKDEYLKRLLKEEETIARLKSELTQMQEDLKNED
jgi:hypothetical protein